MKSLTDHNSASEILSQPATEIKSGVSVPILAQPEQELPPAEILSIPWGHNVVLIHKLKDPAIRIWYAAKTLENGWSRSILTLQIESAAHKRHGKAIGVSEYQLTRKLPKKLKGNLPSIEEIEKELGKP